MYRYLTIAFIICLSSCQTDPNADTSESGHTVSVKKEEPPEPAPPIWEEYGFTLDYVMGKFDPAKDSNFVKIPARFADDDRSYLRKEALEDYIKMHEAAQKDGIKLIVVSATRNFYAQKSIWEAKWEGRRAVDGANLANSLPDPKERALKILEYSSMPGTSRHHWGTDIDLNNLNSQYFEQGKGKDIYDWLNANAATFGFCQPYSAKGVGRRAGYNEEKWHWSYEKLSKPLTAFARDHLKDSLIVGFAGAEAAVPVKMVENYVLGINPACKE